MKKLQELIELVSPTKLKGIEILGKADNLVDRLYLNLHNGQIENDEDALKLLYGSKGSKTGLYQIKEKLYDKLTDSIFIIDLREKNHLANNLANVQNSKSTAAFEILSRRGAQNNIFHLGNKILKSALKFNHAEIITRVARILSRKSAIVFGDEKKMEYYHELYEKYRKIDLLQTTAEHYWYQISIKFNKKRIVVDKSLATKATQYADEIESKLMSDHTCLTFLYLSSLRMRSKEIMNDYEGVLNYIGNNIRLLKKYPDVNFSAYNLFFSKKLSALITLRRYKEANIAAHQNLKFLREGQKPWYTLLESIIILNLYEKKYKTAFEKYLVVVNHSSFKFLTDSRKEMFKVFRAYFQFFINIGLLSLPKNKKEKKPFRYARFRNEVRIFTSDKKGVNITIIVAQFLLLFTEEKYKQAYEKIESVKSYSKKHLRADASFRSNCFLKMLVILVECDFHKAATIRKTKKLYEKLNNHPPDAKRLSSDVEIVPFENLWDIILDRIDNSFRGVFKSKKEKSKDLEKV